METNNNEKLNEIKNKKYENGGGDKMDGIDDVNGMKKMKDKKIEKRGGCNKMDDNNNKGLKNKGGGGSGVDGMALIVLKIMNLCKNE